MTKVERIQWFMETMRDFVNTEDAGDYLLSKGFFTSPASTKYHGNYEGGLFDHSRSVTEALVELTRNNNLKWQHERSPWVVGMFHDLCKCDSYKEVNGVYQYNTDTLLSGHGDKSVMIASTLLKLTEEEVMCIRYHMGAFTEKEEWNKYTGAIHSYPNVLWTHQADMIASHVKGV